jgi:hypothetical protein
VPVPPEPASGRTEGTQAGGPDPIREADPRPQVTHHVRLAGLRPSSSSEAVMASSRPPVVRHRSLRACN